MNWLILVTIAVITDSLRIFSDNYVADVYFKKHEAVSQKLFFGYLFIVTSVILAIITGFNFTNIPINVLLLIVLAGLFNSFSGIPYYRALEIDDSTNIGIFIQLSPILYLIFGWFLLGETFSPFQLIAFVIILAAPLLIVLSSRKRSRKVKMRAIFYAALYVLIDVIGNIIFVKENLEGFNFLTEMIFIFLGKGIGNLLIIYCRPKWRKRYQHVVKTSKGKVFRPLTFNFSASIVKDFAYRSALIAAPAVALASVASDSAEPIVIFFMGIILTLIWPKFGREKLDKKTVSVHLIATALVVAGIILMQI